jgi:hypothetical protein
MAADKYPVTEGERLMVQALEHDNEARVRAARAQCGTTQGALPPDKYKRVQRVVMLAIAMLETEANTVELDQIVEYMAFRAGIQVSD